MITSTSNAKTIMAINGTFVNILMERTTRAVSYTHLDVYKRQIPRIPGRDIAPWRARLFALMSKNATSATDFFKIPTNRVVELGTQLVL